MTYGDVMKKDEIKKYLDTDLEWAKSKGIEPIRGIGHAEETLMNANKGITHIDASRKVCLDCEDMMKQCHVTTDTEKSGKRSKNRLSGCNK